MYLGIKDNTFYLPGTGRVKITKGEEVPAEFAEKYPQLIGVYIKKIVTQIAREPVKESVKKSKPYLTKNN